ISAVAVNFVNHFIFMSPTYYRRVFKLAPVYNTNYVRFKQATKKQDYAYADRLLNLAGVLFGTLMSSEIATNFIMLDSLIFVVLFFVISAGALALVVLYNLTNIYVSERIRELSTIKVFGFYVGEVT
ncbi:ABC transporter permease, partial [Lactobacillus sp. CRM56-2]|nr:ABC transporter permease [Lactobacillus sp. CRM56-2]